MPADARHALLHGPYAAPPFEYGDTVMCEARGEVRVVGLTDAPVPWPVGLRGRARSPVLFAGLADAVRREAATAVAWHWGVTAQTVSKWRAALGVGATTEGTSRLRRLAAMSPAGEAARAKAHAKAGDPARRARIAASRRGVPRPDHVRAVLAAGRAKLAERRRV